MGLDLYALVDLQLVADDADPDKTTRLWVNPDFPASRATPWTTGSYQCTSAGHTACSYGGWSVFRGRLLACSQNQKPPGDAYGQLFTKWAMAIGDLDDEPEGWPFYELMMFSDCEGTLGYVVCEKLDRDFTAMRDRFAAMHPDNVAFYDKVHALIRIVATERGALRFA